MSRELCLTKLPDVLHRLEASFTMIDWVRLWQFITTKGPEVVSLLEEFLAIVENAKTRVEGGVLNWAAILQDAVLLAEKYGVPVLIELLSLLHPAPTSAS